MAERHPVASLIEDLRVSVAFSTRLPLHRADDDPARVGRALRLAPIAGLLVGALVASVLTIGSALGLPPLAAAILALFAGFWFTGGLHEDGLADTADGLGATARQARRLEIMRDPAVGTFGAVALVTSFGLRAVALAAITPTSTTWAALLVAHSFSRALFAPAMFAMPAAQRDGLSGTLVKPTGRDALLSLGLGLGLALAVQGISGALLLSIVGLSAAVLLLLVARWKIGGYTGDVLGALQQVVEIVLLLALASLP